MQPTKPEPMTVTIHEPEVEWLECWVGAHGSMDGITIKVLGKVGEKQVELSIPMNWAQVRQVEGWLGAAIWHNGGT